MRRKIFLAVVSCLAVTEATGDTKKTVVSSVLQDNEGSESAPPPFINPYTPVATYASSVPYGSYSIPAHSYTSPSHIVPAKQEFIHNPNSFLKDSYGNRFVGSPQTVAYKTVFPQQYLQLNNLPEHLSQPLNAGSYQYNSVPHFSIGNPYKLTQGNPPSIPFQNSGPSSQPLVYAANFKNLQQTPNAFTFGNIQTQQPSNHKIVFEGKPKYLQYTYNNGMKFQRLENRPQNQFNIDNRVPNKQFQSSAATQSVVTDINGKKTVINIQTKPSVPLLDLNLLHPLTFANPVVPQVQHYLPRINAVTYSKLPQHPDVDHSNKHQMEFIIQNTKSYDSGLVLNTNKPVPENENTDDKPIIKKYPKTSEVLEVNHINEPPTYKETYTENKVSYNKASESEPEEYSYESNHTPKPIHYSYSSNVPENEQSSKENIQYKETPEPPVQNSSEENSSESEETNPNSYQSDPIIVKDSDVNRRPESLQVAPERQKEEHYHKHIPRESNHHDGSQHDYKNKKRIPHQEPSLQPEYEKITYSSPHNQNKPLKVHSHIKSKDRPRHPHHTSDHSESPKTYHQNMKIKSPNFPPTQVHEKSKRIIIKEESPEEIHTHNEKISAEMVAHDKNNEEDFENAYKNAAYGFPASSYSNEDIEKDIYNADNYGTPKEHEEYNIESGPFEQYIQEDNKYPKTMRDSYKDAKNSNKEDYYLDYSVSSPESLIDRHRNKVNYYKLYKTQRPGKHHSNDFNIISKPKQNDKYVINPLNDFKYNSQDTKSQRLQQFSPQSFEYDFSNENPPDNSAFASRPNKSFKIKSHIFQPQYQFGFKPVSAPLIHDSELVATATNNSPESAKPGARKRIYKENWYIKKTSTSGGKLLR